MKKAIATAPNQKTKHKTLTAAERVERQSEEADDAAKRPMREWKDSVMRTDRTMPRYVEDIIDALPANTKAKIAIETLNAYNEKKQIRSERPND